MLKMSKTALVKFNIEPIHANCTSPNCNCPRDDSSTRYQIKYIVGCASTMVLKESEPGKW